MSFILTSFHAHNNVLANFCHSGIQNVLWLEGRHGDDCISV